MSHLSILIIFTWKKPRNNSHSAQLHTDHFIRELRNHREGSTFQFPKAPLCVLRLQVEHQSFVWCALWITGWAIFLTIEVQQAGGERPETEWR
jgi:hypothetical protein